MYLDFYMQCDACGWWCLIMVWDMLSNSDDNCCFVPITGNQLDLSAWVEMWATLLGWELLILLLNHTASKQQIADHVPLTCRYVVVTRTAVRVTSVSVVHPATISSIAEEPVCHQLMQDLHVLVHFVRLCAQLRSALVIEIAAQAKCAQYAHYVLVSFLFAFGKRALVWAKRWDYTGLLLYSEPINYSRTLKNKSFICLK